MHKIEANAVTVVAADTRAAINATDAALRAHVQLFASVIDGVTTSNLPINVSQDLYARIVAHGGKIVEGREDLKQLITRLTFVKDKSNHREMDAGCPLGLPSRLSSSDDGFFTGASIAPAAQPVA